MILFTLHVTQRSYLQHLDKAEGQKFEPQKDSSCAVLEKEGSELRFQVKQLETELKKRTVLGGFSRVTNVATDEARKQATLKRVQENQLVANIMRDKHSVEITENLALDRILKQKCHTFSTKRSRTVSGSNPINNSPSSTVTEPSTEQVVAKDVVLLIFNNGPMDMVKNLMCSIKRLGIDNVVLMALEAQAYTECLSFAPADSCVIPAQNFSFNSSEFKTWGSLTYKDLTKLKSRNVLEVLLRGYNVMLLDIDLVLLKNPMPLLREKSSEWDLLAQSDARYKQVKGKGEINTGFYYMNSNKRTIDFLTKVWELGKVIPDLSEQKVWNRLLLVRGSSLLRVAALNTTEFPNGSIFFQKKTTSANSELIVGSKRVLPSKPPMIEEVTGIVTLFPSFPEGNIINYDLCRSQERDCV